MTARMMLGAVTLLAFVAPALAFAQSSSEAMKMFGLVGTWSNDCTRQPGESIEYSQREGGEYIRHKVGVFRFTFETFTFAKPMSKLLGGTTIESEIKTAVRAIDDKIKL